MSADDLADFGPLLRVVARLAEDERDWIWFFRALPEPVLRRIAEEFFVWQAHHGQEEPAGDWRVWLLMAGRGFGKTLCGAHWVWARARATPGAQIALVSGSRDDAVKVMVEGPSGLLAAARSDETPEWVPTRGVLTFPNGAEAFVYSGAAPGQLRGPQHHYAWADELAKWRRADEAWDNLMMGLRMGPRPRAIVTTTPSAARVLGRVEAAAETVKTVGRTAENVHLAEGVRTWLEATYGGTRLGRQELDGIRFEQAEGALIAREVLEAARVGPHPSPLPQAGEGAIRRVVVGVDPPASVEGDACGIVVCGLGAGEVVYVLADASVSGLSPEGWARAVARAAGEWGADRVVAEKNNGGDMVESVLRGADCALPVRLVSASRGKAARAEPVTAAFESGRARLAGRFPELEDELCGLTIGGGYEPGTGGGKSPDRADACVWAMTELMKPQAAEPRIRRV